MKFAICDLRFALVCAVCAVLAGCGSLTPEQRAAVAQRLDDAIARYDEWRDSQNQQEAPPPVVVVTNQPTMPENSQGPIADSQGAADFNGLKFRNSQDCRNWPVTITISDVYVRGGNIFWTEARGQREARNWNIVKKNKTINGECILLIPSIGSAGMFDYATTTQRDKILANLKPSHEGPGFFPGWVPKKGERVGFCIATISRDRGHAKMQERSNVVWIEWPRDGI